MSNKTVVLKKSGKFEDVYIKNVPCYFARLKDPQKRMNQPTPEDKNQSTHEYTIRVFVDDDARDALENEVKVNKQLFEVGKDRNKKRVIKFKTSDQLGEDETLHYDDVKGLHGIDLSLKELTNSGSKAPLTVVGPDNKPFDELIGNGSVVTLRLYGYRNRDDLLTVALSLVRVDEHVPYEGGGNSGRIVDDELGIDMDMPEQAKANQIKDEFDGKDTKEDDIDEDDF